ncbi:RHS repeat-associated core domain-containing protein [Trichloromonas sp.]|uniref:RHS repeat-associated core domain-containing protein n=1 Tax=Trichloromonas sp. TaxID=3069249 RepID=UPI003D817676
MTEQLRAGVRLVTNEYDDAGNLTATVDAENNRIEYAYNSRNLLETTTFVDGVDNFFTEQFYDGVGNVLISINEESEVATSTYDKENRLKTTTFAGETTENFYDNVGNLERVQKPRGNDSSMAYDGRNRLEAVTEGGLLTTRYTYDDNDNLRTIEDPRNNIVEYAYDELNRKTQHIQYKSSGNLTVAYDLYDAEGNLKRMTDAKSQVFLYDYDELNRPTRTTYPLVATPFLTIQEVVTGYDANNNVETVTETKQQSGGGTLIDSTVNVWDNFDRLKTSTQRGMMISYGYDNNGNRTSVTSDSGKSTTYTYDHRNRLETAIVGTDTTIYTYTPDSLTDTVSYPNGTSAKYTYWPSNRVETITHRDNAAAVISSYNYQYDANGNRTQQIEEQGGVTETTTYVYDALDDIDRLESFTVTDGTTTTVTDYTFEGYNRKTETVRVDGSVTVDKTYSYDETNWLTDLVDTVPATPVTIAYQYDDNGNTVLKTDSSKPDNVVFAYDVANRMVQTTQGVTLLGQYDYNASGMRVRHYGSERGDVDYFYDDGAVLEERTAGGLLAHYRYGDRLLSLDAPVDGGVQYYHHDALRSTVNLTDSAGSTKVSYTLDPWGHIRSQVGSSVNRQVFTGQEHDENTGLIYFGARYYDPDTARFISQDSYLGEVGTPPSLHRYLYAYSNPTVWVDLKY